MGTCFLKKLQRFAARRHPESWASHNYADRGGF
jgi:hypothetical protein